MELNERELMKVRDMLEDLNDFSKYVIYKDEKKYKENKKVVKKMMSIIDNNDMEDAIDEICD